MNQEFVSKYLIPQFADLIKHVRLHAEVLFKKHQIPLCFQEFLVLRHLIIETGISQKKLATEMFLNKSTLSKILLKMEQNKLITQSICSKDKRIRNLFAAEQGEAYFQQALKYLRNFNETIQGNISKSELETVKHVIQKLRYNLETIL